MLPFHDTATPQRYSLSLHDALPICIGDAVISTDLEGRIVFTNKVAQSLLRMSEADLLRQPLDEVFHLVNEFTRAKIENPIARVLREGAVAGLANHTVLVARDGAEIPIDDSAAPIRSES